MKIIKTRLLPIGRRYAAINLFGVMFVKPGVEVSATMINHESIHTRQMRELLYVGFYVAYVGEWIWGIVGHGLSCSASYDAISFEREAYGHEKEKTYLLHRRHFSMWREK
jgi:hypothetical protein